VTEKGASLVAGVRRGDPRVSSAIHRARSARTCPGECAPYHASVTIPDTR
jgi:hypothetical protein